MRYVSDNETGIVFNEQHSRDFGLRLQSVGDSPLPTTSDQYTDIGAIVGELYQGTSIQTKTINIGFHMVGAQSYQEMERRIHEVAAWLMPDGQDHALRLDLFAGWEFYAHVSGTFDITTQLYNGTFVVPFVCSDPRGYSPLRNYSVGLANQVIGGNESYTSRVTSYIASPESYVLESIHPTTRKTLPVTLDDINAEDLRGKTVALSYTVDVWNAQLLNGVSRVGIELSDTLGVYTTIDPNSGDNETVRTSVTIPPDFSYTQTTDAKSDGQLFPCVGKFTVNTTVNVRVDTVATSKATAQYTSGMAFNYEGKVWANGYLWAEYTNYHGSKSYVAIGTKDGTRYGTDSNAASDPSLTLTTTFPRLVLETAAEYAAIGYPKLTADENGQKQTAYGLSTSFGHNYTGKAHIALDWEKSDDETQASVSIDTKDDTGAVISSIPVGTINDTATTGSIDTVIDWAAVSDDQNAVVAVQRTAGAGTFIIDDIAVYQSDGTVDQTGVIDQFTHKADGIVTSPDDGIIQINDKTSTATSYPEFTLTAQEELTRIVIANKETGNAVQLGIDSSSDDSNIVNRNEPLRVNDRCNTLDTWAPITDPTKVTFDLQNGSVSSGAKITSYPNSIAMAKDKDGKQQFGTLKKSIFCGAVAKHSAFTGSYADWRIVWRAELTCTSPRAAGKIELYLLDAAGSRIGKIMLKDNDNTTKTVLQVQIGSKTDYQEVFFDTTGAGHTGKNKTDTAYSSEQTKRTRSAGSFTNFYGDITFQKKGNVYSMAAMKRNDKGLPMWAKPVTASWTDTAGKYTGKKLNSVALFIGKLPRPEDFKKATKKHKVVLPHDDVARCDDLKVYEILSSSNSSSNGKTPNVIAHAGDEIKISTETGIVYKNGSPYNSVSGVLLKAPSSNITGLAVKAGETMTYAVEPSDQWNIGYRSVIW